MAIYHELAARLGEPDVEMLEDGNMLVKNVPALMSGIWTDSLQRTALEYTIPALEKYADNWMQRGLWARHTGGKQRDLSELVGKVLNPRFKMLGDKGAVMVDLLLRSDMPRGREMMDKIRSGEMAYVSVEHIGYEDFDEAKQHFVTKTLEFTGLALVTQGACRTCTIAAQTNADLKARENEFVMVPNISCDISLNKDIAKLEDAIDIAILNMKL